MDLLRRSIWLPNQFLLFIFLAANACFVLAQTPSTAPSTAETVIACPSVLVNVHVRVNDKSGNEILSLKHKDFLVYEDGIQQEIAAFRLLEESDPESRQGRYLISFHPSDESQEKDYRNIRVALKARHKRPLKVKFSPAGYSATEARSKIND